MSGAMSQSGLISGQDERSQVTLPPFGRIHLQALGDDSASVQGHVVHRGRIRCFFRSKCEAVVHEKSVRPLRFGYRLLLQISG